LAKFRSKPTRSHLAKFRPVLTCQNLSKFPSRSTLSNLDEFKTVLSQANPFGSSSWSGPCGSSSRLVCLGRRVDRTYLYRWASRAYIGRRTCIGRQADPTRVCRRVGQTPLGHLGRLSQIDTSNLEQWRIPKFVEFQFPFFFLVNFKFY